jgi:hypothetical protein
MATFQVPVWFNIEADNREHAFAMVKNAFGVDRFGTASSLFPSVGMESATVLGEYAVDLDDVIEVSE